MNLEFRAFICSTCARLVYTECCGQGWQVVELKKTFTRLMQKHHEEHGCDAYGYGIVVSGKSYWADIKPSELDKFILSGEDMGEPLEEAIKHVRGFIGGIGDVRIPEALRDSGWKKRALESIGLRMIGGMVMHPNFEDNPMLTTEGIRRMLTGLKELL